jgi:hypothetical protein
MEYRKTNQFFGKETLWKEYDDILLVSNKKLS